MTPAPAPSPFSTNLKQLRQKSTLSTQDLAYRSTLPIATIDAFERGSREPTAAEAYHVASALGVDVGRLLGLQAGEDTTPTVDAVAALRHHVRGTETLVNQVLDGANRLEQEIKELRMSEERWRSLAEATFEGVALHNGNLVCDVNPQFVELFGYKREDVLGRPILDFLDPRVHDTVKQVMASESDAEYEALAIDGKGERVRVRIRSRPKSGRFRVAVFRVIRLEKMED